MHRYGGLEEKIGRAPHTIAFGELRGRQNEKSKEYFSVVSAEALRGGGGADSFVQFLLEKGSRKVYDYSTKTNFVGNDCVASRAACPSKPWRRREQSITNKLVLVLGAGIEPTRSFLQGMLSPSRLPVTPPQRFTNASKVY